MTEVLEAIKEVVITVGFYVGLLAATCIVAVGVDIIKRAIVDKRKQKKLAVEQRMEERKIRGIIEGIRWEDCYEAAVEMQEAKETAEEMIQTKRRAELKIHEVKGGEEE